MVAKLSGYGHQSLVDDNREVYDWLRNGVPLERTAADGRREMLRVPVLGFDTATICWPGIPTCPQEKWRAWRDSNPRPTASEAATLSS